MSSVAFWNQIHTPKAKSWKHGVKVPRDDDPALNAALAHFGKVRGKRLLDLGCGNGAASLFFANRGAEVIAVDTSEQAVENLQRYCELRRVKRVRPLALDAIDLELIAPVDFVYGSMVLHHLEPFAEFVEVLHRTLAPGGAAFFYENSSVSRLLVWCRKHLVGRWGIPKVGDDEEFPLMPQEVALLGRRFELKVEQPELLFFRLISMYLLRGRHRAPFAALDRWGGRLPWLRKQSYLQYVKLRRK